MVKCFESLKALYKFPIIIIIIYLAGRVQQVVAVSALTLQAGCSKWHQCEHLPHRQSAVSDVSVNTYPAGRVQQVASVWDLPRRHGVVSGIGVNTYPAGRV